MFDTKIIIIVIYFGCLLFVHSRLSKASNVSKHYVHAHTLHPKRSNSV